MKKPHPAVLNFILVPRWGFTNDHGIILLNYGLITAF